LDKLRKDNASAKDIEKAEIKLKKAQDDYKVLVDKYSNVKEEFEKKMNAACKVKIDFFYLLKIELILLLKLIKLILIFCIAFPRS